MKGRPGSLPLWGRAGVGARSMAASTFFHHRALTPALSQGEREKEQA